VSKQSTSERQAELERAAKYNACPDCKRPTARTGAYGAYIIRGSDQCIRAERDNLRVDVAALRERKQLESALVEAAVEYVGSLDAGTPLDLAIDALVAHRQRNNDGNR